MLNLESESRISIHALREEGDVVIFMPSLLAVEFLSTPSARRATDVDGLLKRLEKISIHALREEGDMESPPHGAH